MRTDPGWHELLDAAVPETEMAADSLDRLTQAVSDARRRRRILVSAVSAAVAVATVAAVALGVTSPWTSGPEKVNRVVGGGSPTPSTNVAAAGLTGAVAYKCGDSLCLMRPDGSGMRTLDATFPEWDPAWSPDGQRLAFRGYYDVKDGTYAIYVVRTDGCHVTRLPGTDGGYQPTWSPDGGRIAFNLGGVEIINADGTGLHPLTQDTRWVDSSPAWSTTGQIAFVRTPHGTTAGEIYTMQPDGTQLTAITSGGHGFEQPAWSPDGSQIAMTATSRGPRSLGSPQRAQIQVSNANGSDRRTVSPPSWYAYDPTWTPDGRIVFLVDNGNSDAYIVNPDGSGLHQLYHHLGGQAESSQITWGTTALVLPSC